MTKSYGGRKAVDGVSLGIRRGEFFGLLGPNGAGKSTLVEIMEGLRRADSGTVSVFGEPPWPRNTALLPRMGVQTQSSAFFVRQTVHEHLRTVAALFGRTARPSTPPWSPWGSAGGTASGWTTSPAGSGSGSPSPRRWSTAPS